MIERVNFEPNTIEAQSIQSPSTSSSGETSNAVPPGHNEVLIHNTSLLGELHWNGTMNAFRLASTFEAQQQQPIDRETLTDPKLTPSGTGVLHFTRSIDPILVRPVGLGEDQNRTPALRDQSPGGDSSLVRSEPAPRAESQAALNVSEGIVYTSREGKPKLVDRGNIDEIQENGQRPVIFRGRLIRIGTTSEFVESLTST